MNISGEKVVLRALESCDSEMLYSIINDPETEYMLGGASFPVSTKAQNDWLNMLKNDSGTLRCAIVPHGELAAVGTVILSDIDYRNGTAEVHIKLCPDGVRGKGYGTDAVSALTEYAFFELRLNCVYARISEENQISQRLFEKCGFKKEGVMRSRMFKRGKYINWISYSVLSAEYADQRGK